MLGKLKLTTGAATVAGKKQGAIDRKTQGNTWKTYARDRRLAAPVARKPKEELCVFRNKRKHSKTYARDRRLAAPVAGEREREREGDLM